MVKGVQVHGLPVPLTALFDRVEYVFRTRHFGCISELYVSHAYNTSRNTFHGSVRTWQLERSVDTSLS